MKNLILLWYFLYQITAAAYQKIKLLIFVKEDLRQSAMDTALVWRLCALLWKKITAKQRLKAKPERARLLKLNFPSRIFKKPPFGTKVCSGSCLMEAGRGKGEKFLKFSTSPPRHYHPIPYFVIARLANRGEN